MKTRKPGTTKVTLESRPSQLVTLKFAGASAPKMLLGKFNHHD